MRQFTNENNLLLVQEEPIGPSQLIEVQVTKNGISEIAFPDIPNLRNQSEQLIIIKAMRLVTDEVLTNAPISGLPVAPLAELKKMTVVLYCEGWQKGQSVPILFFNDMQVPNGTAPASWTKYKLDSWRNLDWNKSTIQYSNGTPSAGASYAVVFNIEYVRMIKNNNGEWVEILGAG